MADAAAPPKAATSGNYSEILAQALEARKDWLERSELVKLKEELRIFQISYSVLYNMFLKKKLIHEDPYKQETKISELAIPESGPLNEAKRLEQISLRLANYDSQLDFLVNFYQFGIDFFNLERVRKIVGLVRYVDWINLSPDSKSPNTKAAAELVSNAKDGGDSLTLSIIGESITRLPKCTSTIMGILRNLIGYYKEMYKLSVRNAVTNNMQAGEANPANIRKKMNSALPGTPFYQEFIDELIKEDYSKDGPAMKEAILASLKVADEKPKTTKPKVSYKDILLSGIQAVGAAASVVTEVAQKIDANEAVLENRKKGFWEKIKLLLKSMTNSDPDEIIYELQFFDQIKGTETREQLNFGQFRTDLDRKIKIYTGMSGQGPFMNKLKAMAEEQVLEYLERAVKDLQSLHRTLTSLDEYFKSSVVREERDQIKGVKPELASIKNCFVKANQIRHEYSARKEEEEQMKKLGINPDS
jgi:polyhydroxyalkanoate synthesis regulator protein